MTTSSRSRIFAAGGIAGPVAFIGAWSFLGTRVPHYSPVRDAISQLAAMHAPTRAPMTAGFVAFGIGMPLYAISLRSAAGGKAWMAAAATGVATLGVAAFPLGTETSDLLHAACAVVGYATLAATPILASPGFARAGRSRQALASKAVGVVSGLCLAATVVGSRKGLFQRAGLTIADIWVIASACDLVRRPN